MLAKPHVSEAYGESTILGKKVDFPGRFCLLEKYEQGFNAKECVYGNMRELNIIDSHLVVRSSLTHAVSVACNILLVGCAVSIEDSQQENLNMIENI